MQWLIQLGESFLPAKDLGALAHPFPEGPEEGARLGIAELHGNLTDGHRRVQQQFDGEIPADVVLDGGIALSLVVQTVAERGGRHSHIGGKLGKARPGRRRGQIQAPADGGGDTGIIAIAHQNIGGCAAQELFERVFAARHRQVEQGAVEAELRLMVCEKRTGAPKKSR